MYLDETTSRADLEFHAIFSLDLPLDKIEASTDAELLALIRDWIESGNEAA